MVTACSTIPPTASRAVNETGLKGTVRRGPIQPVCTESEPCIVPFSAGFEVRSGTAVVARFHSDSAGRFLVALSPGEYSVRPDSEAPPLGILPQAHAVTVRPTGLTQVELDFDTGIR